MVPSGSLERPIGGGRLMPYEFVPGAESISAVTNALAVEPGVLTVYPTPVISVGVVQITLEEAYPEVIIAFYDLSTGKAVLTQDFQEEQHLQVTITNLAKGLYGIKVFTEGKSWKSKLVVQ